MLKKLWASFIWWFATQRGRWRMWRENGGRGRVSDDAVSWYATKLRHEVEIGEDGKPVGVDRHSGVATFLAMTIVIALLLVQILQLRVTHTLNDNLCKSAVGLSRQQEAIAEAVKAARSMRTSP